MLQSEVCDGLIGMQSSKLSILVMCTVKGHCTVLQL